MNRLIVNRDELFKTTAGQQFPQTIRLLTDFKERQSDMDIIIGSHGQCREVNLVIQNYLKLEKQLKLHIYVIESSWNPINFYRILNHPQVSKIWIMSHPECTSRHSGIKLAASNGAALSAQIGEFFSQASHVLFSHSDMMAYRKDPFSYLMSKLGEKTPLASFFQRHAIPFTGGMLYNKSYFSRLEIDWLPKEINPYSIPWLKNIKELQRNTSWIDSGEELIYKVLSQNDNVYVCANRGGSYGCFNHPLDRTGVSQEQIVKLNRYINYAECKLTEEEFRSRYPKLISNRWRNSFDDEGKVIFIHRGRGVYKKHSLRNRLLKKSDYFLDFISNFNKDDI